MLEKLAMLKLLYLLQLHHFSLSINLRAARGSRLTTVQGFHLALLPPTFHIIFLYLFIYLVFINVVQSMSQILEIVLNTFRTGFSDLKLDGDYCDYYWLVYLLFHRLMGELVT